MPRKHWVEVDYPHSSTFYPHGSALQGTLECRPFQRYTCPAFQECFLGHQSVLSFFYTSSATHSNDDSDCCMFLTIVCYLLISCATYVINQTAHCFLACWNSASSCAQPAIYHPWEGVWLVISSAFLPPS